jgi:hypothetical protein
LAQLEAATRLGGVEVGGDAPRSLAGCREEGGEAAVEVEDGSDARIEGGSSGHAWPPATIRYVEGDGNRRSGRDDNVGWEGVGGGAAWRQRRGWRAVLPAHAGVVLAWERSTGCAPGPSQQEQIWFVGCASPGGRR